MDFPCCFLARRYPGEFFSGLLEFGAGGCLMPTISMFYGILVAMMFEDNERHNLPHTHVR